MNRVAAIVPAFNEEPTIAKVVAVLRSSSLVDEVIVVSDGSTDGTSAAASAAGATVYDLERKGGKGNAMLHALTRTDAQVILFCDADLKGFTLDHVGRLLEPVLNGGRVMNVGLRDRGTIINRFSQFLPLIGGERAILRRIVEAVPPQYLSGFMVESALNYYCRYRRMPYGSVLLRGLSIRRKYEKVGWKEGLKQYRRMITQVVKAMLLVRWAHLWGKF
ncbi:MAG: glycosyltransferase [Patescibacteria group bacterium]